MYRETKVLGGALDFSFVPPILCYCFVVLSEEYGNVDDEICNRLRTDSSILSLAPSDAGIRERYSVAHNTQLPRRDRYRVDEG